MVSPNFLSPQSPSTAAEAKSSLPMLYYGLIVVGTASIVLALYNLIVLRWCADRRTRPPEMHFPFVGMGRIGNGNRNGRGSGNGNGVILPASFRYKKGEAEGQCECAVCLSAFEEAEEIRSLTRCRHAFHAECIDMWLFSHADCPLCRAPVGDESSREVLIVNPVITV